VAFSPDGKRRVSGRADRTLKVWDIGRAALPSALWPCAMPEQASATNRPAARPSEI
jgi:hypothetical protein